MDIYASTCLDICPRLTAGLRGLASGDMSMVFGSDPPKFAEVNMKFFPH